MRFWYQTILYKQLNNAIAAREPTKLDFIRLFINTRSTQHHSEYGLFFSLQNHPLLQSLFFSVVVLHISGSETKMIRFETDQKR